MLSAWSSFYVMAGSSAAALTGLMFVVVTLVNNMEAEKRTRDGLSTFSTPTVMHFCAALLISAILVAPWRATTHPAALVALAGLSGIVYVARVTYLARGLTTYVPDLEDWAWYIILPFAAYGAIFFGALGLFVLPLKALFVVAGAIVLLIFVGIRNAWDVVTFLAIRGRGSGA